MMKAHWLGLVLAAAGVATTGVAAAQAGGGGTPSAGPLKVAVIDLRSVLQQSPGYSQAESTFTKEVEGYRVEMSRMQDSLVTAQKDFEKSSVVMSPSARAAKQKELDARQTRMEQRASELQQKAAAREQELLAPIQNKVNGVIDGIRTEGGYTLILDVSAANSGILFADRALDITPKVLEKLKAAP
jgi:outer membrane protein